MIEKNIDGQEDGTMPSPEQLDEMFLNLSPEQKRKALVVSFGLAENASWHDIIAAREKADGIKRGDGMKMAA